MRSLYIFKKTYTGQIRNYWLLILTLLMAPFFVFVFYLINESAKLSFDLVLLSNPETTESKTLASDLAAEFGNAAIDSLNNPFRVKISKSRDEAIQLLRYKKADILISLPDHYIIKDGDSLPPSYPPKIEFMGDLSDYNYMLAAIYAHDIIERYFKKRANISEFFTFEETAIGNSAITDEFDYYIPGLLILSVIMLLFTASISFVSEIENKTIIRLKMTGLKTHELIGGIALIQSIIGILAVLLTLLCALSLGFSLNGHLGFLILIAFLSSLSIIAFSLIIAAFTKSAGEILVVGNFPMFLFMFFTGAVFPISSPVLFSFMNYDFQLHALMSPAHAISALNKVLVTGSPVAEAIPEIISLVTLTGLYFIAGLWAFSKRHLNANTI